MRTASIFIVSALAAACSSVTTHSHTAPGADLTHYQSYSWYPTMTQPTTIADQEIRVALAHSLGVKGFTESPDHPDVLVACHTYFQQNTDVNGWGWGWGYDYGWGGPSYYTYTQGTIVVDFIDPNTNKVVWRGTASSVVNDPNNISQSKIDKSVSKMMKNYPVSVVASGQPPAYR